jgi:hypothetical protein
LGYAHYPHHCPKCGLEWPSPALVGQRFIQCPGYKTKFDLTVSLPNQASAPA